MNSIDDKLLSPSRAISQMEDDLGVMREEEDRTQIKTTHPELTVDEAFELGYYTAIWDYKHYTGDK